MYVLENFIRNQIAREVKDFLAHTLSKRILERKGNSYVLSEQFQHIARDLIDTCRKSQSVQDILRNQLLPWHKKHRHIYSAEAMAVHFTIFLSIYNENLAHQLGVHVDSSLPCGLGTALSLAILPLCQQLLDAQSS